MRRASVADLRNNFATVSKWIQEGESVTITKRGQAFATRKKKKDAPPWPDRAAWRRRIFRGGHAKGDVQEMLDYDRCDTWMRTRIPD